MPKWQNFNVHDESTNGVCRQYNKTYRLSPQNSGRSEQTEQMTITFVEYRQSPFRNQNNNSSYSPHERPKLMSRERCVELSQKRQRWHTVVRSRSGRSATPPQEPTGVTRGSRLRSGRVMKAAPSVPQTENNRRAAKTFRSRRRRPIRRCRHNAASLTRRTESQSHTAPGPPRRAAVRRRVALR